MSIDKLEKNWTDREFSFGIGTIKSGDSVNQAVHDDKDELVFMEAGKYKFTIDNETFMQEGNIEVLIPAGANHSIKNIGPKDSKIYYGYKSKN
jgi:mannose-6-phosphate isomerase-like protein (cupin superfamily)